MSSISSENVIDVEGEKNSNLEVRQIEVNPGRISPPDVLHQLMEFGQF
jgi:hypothetical protein